VLSSPYCTKPNENYSTLGYWSRIRAVGMAKRQVTNFDSLREQLHQSPRNWHRLNREIAPLFSNLFLFQRVEIPEFSSRSSGKKGKAGHGV